jgi:ABC-2 type transport system ATP-binding protein
VVGKLIVRFLGYSCEWRGGAFGLIGENGAGKTTFIKLLLSVARPSGGTIRVLGGDPEDIAIRARIGYLPERLDLPSKGTPRSYLASVARFKRCRVDSARNEKLIERVGLGADSILIRSH